jgi:hypothetical protein
MRESTDCVESALRGGNDVEQMVAMRIVETPGAFHRWENEHAQLMRGVADYSALRNQVGALKHTTIRLIHGKALFEHLKKKEVLYLRHGRGAWQLFAQDLQLSVHQPCRHRDSG